jgi:hypothetical protein
MTPRALLRRGDAVMNVSQPTAYLDDFGENEKRAKSRNLAPHHNVRRTNWRSQPSDVALD